MADYFAGELEIGGEISRTDLNTLIEMILNQQLQKEYGDIWKRDELVAAFALEPSIRVVNDQARYGEFPELEAWLIDHKIPFNRHSDARYEYDAVNTYIRVKGNKVTNETFYSTQNGNTDLLPLYGIESIITDDNLSDTEKVNKIRGIITSVEPLPPIKII